MTELEDWKEVLESVEKLGENEDNEKIQYIFNILYALIKFVIELMEEGLDIPNKVLKKLSGEEEHENEESIEEKLNREKDPSFYS